MPRRQTVKVRRVFNIRDRGRMAFLPATTWCLPIARAWRPVPASYQTRSSIGCTNAPASRRARC